MFKKILVATDGSDTALEAAKHALALAEKFSSEITIIHVIENYYNLPAFIMPDTISVPLSVLTDLEENGKLILEKTAEIFANYPGKVSTILEYGSPGKQIVATAVAGNFSLIVVGRHGLGSISELLLGSVSNHIVHSAPCPALIVKEPISC